ncbi:MAG: hypothetical protein IT210_16270 [Armatimonadetes bacterium]|nr:hypothetical protein [Armatimonadota bacterium]
MISKERVKRAIHFDYPDRLPLLFRSDPERSDIIGVGYGRLDGWRPLRENEDEWGCVWDNLIGTGIGQVVEHPLADWKRLESYRFPSACDETRFRGIAAVVSQYPDRYIAASLGISGFTIMMFLRGFENLLADLCESPERVDFLADAIFAFEAEIIEAYAGRGIDGVWLYDDWGTETALMIRPDMWRRVFKPRYREQFRLIHERGMDVIFHSCGQVWDIIPDLIEIGADMLNLEQPLVFGSADEDGASRLDREFGGKVAFCTNPDSQKMLPCARPEEIRAEAARLVRILSRPEGGFIPLADCGKDHHTLPPENVEAMIRAFVELQV